MPENPKSPRDQFLDDLLDASLREYGRTEPRIGLESRVLRRLEDAPPKTFWMTGWRWSAVGAVATVIVVALALISYPPDAPLPSQLPKKPNTGNLYRTIPDLPPDRTPRYNQTIPASGVRPDLGNGVKPQLPPCKPGEEPKTSAKKSLKESQESTTSKTKVSEDCVPASSKQPHDAPAPHR